MNRPYCFRKPSLEKSRLFQILNDSSSQKRETAPYFFGNAEKAEARRRFPRRCSAQSNPITLGHHRGSVRYAHEEKPAVLRTCAQRTLLNSGKQVYESLVV